MSGVEDLLYDYAAGELSEEESVRVEEALARSPRLREELGRYERLLVVLTAAAQEEVEAPASLQGRVDRQVLVGAYLQAATSVVEGIIGAYGRAFVYYLGLAR